MCLDLSINYLIFYIPRSLLYLWFYQLSMGFSISKLSHFTTSPKKNTTENPCNVSSKAIKRLGVPKCGAVRKPPLKSRPEPWGFHPENHGKVGKKNIREPYHLVTWGPFNDLYLGFTMVYHIRRGDLERKVGESDKKSGLRDIGWN